MRRPGFRSALALALAAVALSAVSCSLLFDRRLPQAERAPAVGATAPEFTLADQRGRAVALSSLRGRQVVLVFYRGFW